MSSAEKDVGQMEPSHIAGGNKNMIQPLGKWFDSFFKYVLIFKLIFRERVKERERKRKKHQFVAPVICAFID